MVAVACAEGGSSHRRHGRHRVGRRFFSASIYVLLVGFIRMRRLAVVITTTIIIPSPPLPFSGQ